MSQSMAVIPGFSLSHRDASDNGDNCEAEPHVDGADPGLRNVAWAEVRWEGEGTGMGCDVNPC